MRSGGGEAQSKGPRLRFPLPPSTFYFYQRAQVVDPASFAGAICYGFD